MQRDVFSLLRDAEKQHFCRSYATPSSPALGWDKWHRVCFRALVKYQHENGGVGPILCGFMVGSNFEAVQSGFDKFVGEGMVESLPGVPKIRPEEIIIVLPDQATLVARG